ncbi:MAG: hypothetical protein JNM56_11495 [Planctomycetia bacterium]|nr:hypothetical protein [Planctomycetia bacterium]
MNAGFRWLVRQLRVGRLVVLALIGCLGVGYWYAARLASDELQATVAEADAADPGWPLEDWRWGRLPNHEGDPGLQALRAAATRLPEGWPEPDLINDLRSVSRDARLPAATRARLHAALAEAESALAEARQLAANAPAPARVSWQAPWSIDLGQIQTFRPVNYLLYYDALDRADQGDVDGALRASRAMLHGCRAIDGTALGIGFLVRLVNCEMALSAIEATLAWTQPADAALVDLQSLVAAEQRAPLLTEALRHERASLHWGFVALESGETPMSSVNYVAHGTNAVRLPAVASAYDRLGTPMLRYVHAWLLRYCGEMYAASRLPCTEQPAALMQLRLMRTPRWWTVPPAANVLAFGPELFDHSLWMQARMRCILVALAVERHRLRTGAWPQSLDEVAPQPQPEAGTDPFDGEPLRYRRLPDGVAIYSVGPDLKDAQGHFDQNRRLPGTDVGVRLWDAERRARPE